MIVKQETFTEALLEGAREVFETMMFMTVEEGDGESSQSIEGEAILGSITFQGTVEGCLTICCDANCAKTISRNMLGMEPDEEITHDDMIDAMGEVANMVMGSMKARLLDSCGDLQVSIPSVVTGTKLESALGESTEEVLRMVNLDEETAIFHLSYRKMPDAD
ncbi:MAG: chemotaxis protein CheX [Planctomycetota bacterium]|jgi:chemotaxis protein CheX